VSSVTPAACVADPLFTHGGLAPSGFFALDLFQRGCEVAPGQFAFLHSEERPTTGAGTGVTAGTGGRTVQFALKFIF
jgi:hypothetical protein